MPIFKVVASAHIENYAVKLFSWADREDRASNFNKNVVKAFYTSGILFEVMNVFGELTPENAHHQKYSKWKAAYIHNCLKNGETPVPGPAGGDDDELAGAVGGEAGGWQVPQIPEHVPQSEETPVAPPRAQPPPPAASAVPSPAPAAIPAVAPVAAPVAEPYSEPASDSGLTPDQVRQTQKYCKFATSALDYDDKATAISNLEKALRLLKTGRDS